MSENHITPRATRILLLSRDRLSQILSRANAPIDLRFEPKNGTSRYRWFDLPKSAAESRSSSRESSLELGVQLIMAGAPRYLKAFAGLSVVTAFAAFLYAMYAVAAFVFLPHLQPGWFSSSIFQAGSVGFMSLGMTVFSLALVSIHERQNTGDIDVVLREVGNTSFFEHSADTIVELASSSIASSNDRN